MELAIREAALKMLEENNREELEAKEEAERDRDEIARVREPNCQKQRKNNLNDKVSDPQNERVAQGGHKLLVYSLSRTGFTAKKQILEVL